MAKITRAHIIAARGRKRILEDQKKSVPVKIIKLASLDPAKFPREASSRSTAGRHLPQAEQDQEVIAEQAVAKRSGRLAEVATQAGHALASVFTDVKH